MKKRQTPTPSQYCTMTAKILTALIDRGEEVTDELIEKSVKQAVYTLEKIYEVISENEPEPEAEDDEEQEVFVVDYFADYPWDGRPARYTDLEKWLKETLGTNSNRRISNIFKKAYAERLIIKDPNTGKYTHHSFHSLP